MVATIHRAVQGPEKRAIPVATVMGRTSSSWLGRRALLMGSVGAALSGATGCGSQRPTKVHRTRRGVLALAADDTHLCWVTGPEQGKLFVALGDEGMAVPKHHNLDWARDLTLHDGHAYLALDQGVVRASLEGGPPRELTGRGEPVQRLRVVVDALLWLERRSGSLWRGSPEGGQVQRLATGPASPTGLVVVADHVYWTAGESGQLQRVPLGGGEPELIHRADHPLTHLVALGRRIFWCTPTAVMSMSVDGGAPEVVVAKQVAPSGLVVSAAALGWVNGRPGEGQGAADVMAKRHGAGEAVVVVDRGVIVQALALVGRRFYWADQGVRWIMRALLK